MKTPLYPDVSLLTTGRVEPKPIDELSSRGLTTPRSVYMTVLSGSPLFNYVPYPTGEEETPFLPVYRRFAFDLSSVQFNSSVPIDFNHNRDEVIGSVNLDVTNGRLIGNGIIVPFEADDRAAEVAYKIDFIPFGISPTVSFNESEEIWVDRGEHLELNGAVFDGPIHVYKKCQIIGVAVCPYPTDTGTEILALQRSFLTKYKMLFPTLTKESFMSIFKKSGKENLINIFEQPDKNVRCEPPASTTKEEEEKKSAPTIKEEEEEEEKKKKDQDTDNSGEDKQKDIESFATIASMSSAIKNLSDRLDKNLATLNKYLSESREEFSKLAVLAKRAGGGDPVSPSHSSGTTLSYEDAINRSLDRWN